MLQIENGQVFLFPRGGEFFCVCAERVLQRVPCLIAAAEYVMKMRCSEKLLQLIIAKRTFLYVFEQTTQVNVNIYFLNKAARLSSFEFNSPKIILQESGI